MTMDRIKPKDFAERLEILNGILAERGPWRVIVGGRYGYQAIDIFKGKDLIRNHRTGLTMREAWDALGDMTEGASLYQRGET